MSMKQGSRFPGEEKTVKGLLAFAAKGLLAKATKGLVLVVKASRNGSNVLSES